MRAVLLVAALAGSALVLFSGEAWARAERLACRGGACDDPIFGSLAIIGGAIFIAAPLYPPLWRVLGEHEDDKVLKVGSIIFGVFAVGLGIYLFG